MIDKDKLIKNLIADDISTITQMLENGDTSYLYDILHESYINWSESKLVEELQIRKE